MEGAEQGKHKEAAKIESKVIEGKRKKRARLDGVRGASRRCGNSLSDLDSLNKYNHLPTSARI